MRSRIEPMKKIARMLRSHRELLLNYFKAKKEFSSGVIEGRCITHLANYASRPLPTNSSDEPERITVITWRSSALPLHTPQPRSRRTARPVIDKYSI